MNTIATKLVNQRYTDTLDSVNCQFNNELVNAFLSPEQFKASKFNTFSLELLLDYLKKTHQLYLTKKLDEIQHELSILTFKENNEQLWLPMALKLFMEFSANLSSHIAKEEDNLFPYIDSLIEDKDSKVVNFDFEQKIKLVGFLLEHDDNAEKSLRFIIELLEKKAEFFYDQLALGVLISRLKHFETDLLVHAKLEDEVLIPKAIELELEVLS